MKARLTCSFRVRQGTVTYSKSYPVYSPFIEKDMANALTHINEPEFKLNLEVSK